MTDRSRIGRRSRTKGASFERWVSSQLKPYFSDTRRQPQSQIKQLKAIAATDPTFNPCLTDVVAGPFGIECKHRKVLPHWEESLEQARDDVGASGKVPVAVHKPHGGTAYDIEVRILYFGDVIRMTWIEFLANCKRISQEKKVDDRGNISPGQYWEPFPDIAD